MSYIGNTTTTQSFTPAIDYFSGNGSTVAFTLSRPVASVAQVQVTVNNVAQNPSTAFTVSSNTITFTGAPSSGTNNIYVQYTSPITQVIQPGQGTVQTLQLGTITNIASGNSSLTLQTGTTPTTAVTIDTSQNVGIGTSSPNAYGAGYTAETINNSTGAVFDLNIAGTRTATFYALSDGTIRVGSQAAYPLQLITGGSERMRIDSSGNVGIGTSTPTSYGKVAVVKSGQNAFAVSDASNYTVAIGLSPSAGGGSVGWIGGTSGSALALGANNAENVRIDTSGNLLVGATAIYSNEKFNVTQSAAAGGINVRLSSGPYNSTSYAIIQGVDGTTTRFYFPSNGGLYNYSANNTNLSDERTKTDIQDAGSYLSKICAIPVRTFKYKDQTDDLLNLGVIAQEVETVAPELVNTDGFGDDIPEDGVPLKGVYQTDLQYALMKCIQEQQALITQQAAALTTLTERITALEAK